MPYKLLQPHTLKTEPNYERSKQSYQLTNLLELLVLLCSIIM